MKVLVGIDGGDQQADALALGERLAGIWGAELVVATVYEWSPWSGRMGDWHREAVEGAADAVLESARGALPRATYTTRRFGDRSPASGLHALIDAERPEVLVLGACHRGKVGQALLGGVAERVAHGAACPVAVAPRGYASEAKAPAVVGAAYDGSADADAAVAWARALAERCGASLRLLAVVHPVPIATYPGVGTYPHEEVLRDVRAGLQRQVDEALARLPASLHATGEVLDGPVAATLAQAASGVDLLVTGSRGYGPVGATLLGSVSRGLLHRAPCPLVVLPHVAGPEPVPAAEHARAAPA